MASQKKNEEGKAKHPNYFANIDNAVNLYRQKFKKEEEELQSYLDYKSLRTDLAVRLSSFITIRFLYYNSGVIF